MIVVAFLLVRTRLASEDVCASELRYRAHSRSQARAERVLAAISGNINEMDLRRPQARRRFRQSIDIADERCDADASGHQDDRAISANWRREGAAGWLQCQDVPDLQPMYMRRHPPVRSAITGADQLHRDLVVSRLVACSGQGIGARQALGRRAHHDVLPGKEISQRAAMQRPDR